MLVQGLVHVLWDDLLDVGGPGLHGGEAQRGLYVGVLLEDVEGLYEELGQVVLGVVLLGLGAAAAFRLGVDHEILSA